MKSCAFCLRPAKMSGEHVWSDWIGKLFADYKGMYSFRTTTTKNRPDRHWQTHSIDMKAHVVCESCNNTWMSDLDGEAKATMKDMIRYAAYISLLPRGIASIAAFTLKTAVVADHIRPHRTPFFSHTARKQFAATFAIPAGVQVWLSAFRGKHLLSGRYSTIYAKIGDGRFKGFELYIFTYVAGFLALQLSASRWTSIAKKPLSIPLLTQHSAWDRVSVPLWPSDGTAVVWPPPEHLNDESLNIFSGRWAKLRETR